MAGLLARIAREESASERTCVVTGEKGPPDAMLRFALSPEGVVTPDIRRKLPGRGVWTRLDQRVVARAAKGLSRGFRKNVSFDSGLAAKVDELLLDDALRFLGMVNKAGLVVAGAAKVEAALRSGRVVALIHAREGAADGIEKLDRLARAAAKPPLIINLFESLRLDLALGRTNVIHAALRAGSVSAAFLVKFARLSAYRSGEAVGMCSTVTDVTLIDLTE
jgi:hypothetical protein